MNKADIVVDNYKLSIFRRNLKDAGYKWEEILASENTIMEVELGDTQADQDALRMVIRTCEAQARRARNERAKQKKKDKKRKKKGK